MSRYPRIRRGDDGMWHAWLTVGAKPDGLPDRRHVKRRTENECRERVDELLAQRRAGAVVKSRPGTVAAWLETYLATVAPRRCKPGTVQDYRSIIATWVLPVVGPTRLDRLKPEQLDEVYLRMQRAGRAPSMVLKAHRVLKRALEQAYRRSLVPRNVAALIDAPSARPVEMSPLTMTEARQVLAAAAGTRNAARWSVALALGLRQGEALGLRWQYVDLDAGTIRVWWQLERRGFEHGCQPACGRRRAGNCPQRHLPVRAGETVLAGGLILTEPKGKSRRVVPVPAELVAALRAHREVQDLERMVAEGAYARHGLVFAGLDGSPVSPERDHAEWKALLADAGVRVARVHDARHTAGTLLMAQGVDVRTVQELLGHSDVRTTQGYTHVASEMARDATDRMGSALLNRPPAP